MPVGAEFPRSARITRAAEFGEVFAGRVRISATRLSLRLKIRPEPDVGARLGMAISKRNAKTAVLRNRIKRLLRDRFRHLRQQLPAVDLVVQLRGPISMDRTTDLADEFSQLIQRGCKRLELPFPAAARPTEPADLSSKDAN